MINDQSLELPASLASGYKSATQQARVLTEAWALAHLSCMRCGGKLSGLAANTKVCDFACAGCGESYQLKASRGRLKTKLTGAAFGPTRNAFLQGEHPSLLLLAYSTTGSVTDVELIFRGGLTESCLIARKPLGPHARRAGWQGCIIVLEQLPRLARVAVVSGGKWADLDEVRKGWAAAERGLAGSGETRSWIADVMRIVERLPSHFAIASVYESETELARLHPDNQNIRAKIRQQLQVLRDRGLVEFVSPGKYSKSKSLAKNTAV